LHSIIKTDNKKSLELFLEYVNRGNKELETLKNKPIPLKSPAKSICSKLVIMCYIAKKNNLPLYDTFLAELSKDQKNARLLFESADSFGSHSSDKEENAFQRTLKIDLFTKASELGDILATRKLCLLSLNLPNPQGGETRNVLEAYKWIRRGAELNDLEAMYALGEYLITGRYQNDFNSILLDGEVINYPQEEIAIIPPNPEEALKWYKKAAEGGQALSMIALAKIYLGSYPSPSHLNLAKYINPEQGYQLALEAANAKNRKGYLLVINCLENGIGVEKNEALAKEFEDKLKIFESNQTTLNRLQPYHPLKDN